MSLKFRRDRLEEKGLLRKPRRRRTRAEVRISSTRRWADDNGYVEVGPGHFVSEMMFCLKPEFGGLPR